MWFHKSFFSLNRSKFKNGQQYGWAIADGQGRRSDFLCFKLHRFQATWHRECGVIYIAKTSFLISFSRAACDFSRKRGNFPFAMTYSS
jgi:hypothetical protein